MEKSNKKAYIIKGCCLENGFSLEWIESIYLSQKKAESSKKKLNSDLKDLIEKGAAIGEKYLKSDKEKVEWNKREYGIEFMNEDEYALFYLYKGRKDKNTSRDLFLGVFLPDKLR